MPKLKTSVLRLGLLAAACIPALALSAPVYTVVDLGTLGSSNSASSGINNGG